jgi:hypothetical protein
VKNWYSAIQTSLNEVNAFLYILATFLWPICIKFDTGDVRKNLFKHRKFRAYENRESNHNDGDSNSDDGIIIII